jgi:MFS family permease
MSREPKTRTQRLRGDLRRIYADAIAFSVMVGSGETYLAAFVLALGLGEVNAGLIAAVPMLAGGIIQLISPWAVRKLGSHRRWVVLCAVTQASAFIPLVIAALVGRMPVAAVYVMAALYWGAGLATGPAWNTWVGSLVPRSIRANYFAQRSRAAHFAVLCGLVGGGLSLQFGESLGKPLTAFAVLFLIAAGCRFISATLLAGQREPQKPDDDHRLVSWPQFIARFRHGHDGRLLAYMLATQLAVQISGPYFTPFMFEKLHFSYATYLLLIATSYVSRMLVLPWLGEWVRAAGARRVLWFAGLGIVPLSAMWLVSGDLIWLIIVQLLAGAMWAAYELATFLLLFETIPEKERTSVLTLFNASHAMATVTGAALGGWLLHAFGTNHAAYMMIFALSGGVRVCAIVLLARAARVLPSRDVPQHAMPLPTRVLAVRPNLGSFEKPILPAFSPEAATVEAATEWTDQATMAGEEAAG